jgi:hypothetical protein
MIKTDWRIIKSATKRNAWDIETRAFEQSTRDDGYLTWNMVRNWSRHSTANSKRAAIVRASMLRNRGEIVSWNGNAISL